MEAIAYQTRPPFVIEAVLAPARQAWRRWRELEPYEYRLPVHEKVLLAMCGVAMQNADWRWLMYLVLAHHRWLRPAETLAIKWCDVTLLWEEQLALGVVRITNPKVKRPRVQYVLMEASWV